eukprot:TRINITY_DN45936_c0_g1_i1.p1 TRINITY_DN45936_c0_g1~~TRINITY_DN45936_c0_g1_i1.p1  ORF type:complete len:335 (-),score=61.50 TRINITY_DN45936_c0_g1_i1:35-1039(-)
MTDVPPGIVETLHNAGLQLNEFGGKKGRGVMAARNFKCGEILLQDKGFHAKTMEKLTTLLLASEEGRQAARHSYAGPLHHLKGFQRNDESLPEGATEEDWMEMYAKVRYNTFQLDGSSCHLPYGCLFNHSCSPCATLMRVEPLSECNVVVVVIAEDGIRTGQEVQLCYDSELLFEPLPARRRELMSAWSFLCKCDRCQAEEAKMDKGEPREPAPGADEYEELTCLSSERLQDSDLYRARQDILHQPGLPFQLRKKLFSTHLASACAILPSLHPALRDIYEQLHELCAGSSAPLEHCARVVRFYEQLRQTGSAPWPPCTEPAPASCERQQGSGYA